MDRNQQPYIPAKTHKFFDRHLDNDLNLLARQLEKRYSLIEQAKVKGVTELKEEGEFWVDSGSLSTVKWREYNVFQFHIEGIYNLYKAIGDMAREACEYYGIDFEEQNYMIQGWFNINKKDSGLLNWHDHGSPGAPNFHGYYCVNAEPSVTHYRVAGVEIENINKDNRAIFSEMGHPHAQGSWDWEGNRITVAYDVVPLRTLPGVPEAEQHWLPLR